MEARNEWGKFLTALAVLMLVAGIGSLIFAWVNRDNPTMVCGGFIAVVGAIVACRK